MSRFSLKIKATLFFPFVIAAALFCLLLFIQLLFHGYLKESISSQQDQIVSNSAEEIDRELVAAQKPLLALANKLPVTLLANPDESLAFLLERTESTGYFDNGMFLFDANGRIIAELPLGTSRTGQDFSFRDYLKITFTTKKPHISDPYISSQSHHHPAIMLTAPIFDQNGAVAAVLCGSIDLIGNNFLGGINRRRIGRTGYQFLFDLKRTMIVHPDKSRIMKQDIPPGANRLLDRALTGFEGTEETVNSRGLKTLATFKRLKAKEWIVGGNFPLAEAYQPIYRIRNVFLIAIPLLTLSMFLFMRRYLKRLTAPIIQLTNHVEDLSGKTGDERFFTEQGEEEITTLGRAFNELVRETDQQRFLLEDELKKHVHADELLHRQNQYLQALHETTLGLITRLDVASVLQAIVLRSGRLVGTEHCFLYLVNTTKTEMNMVYQSGIYEALTHDPVRFGEGICGKVWATGTSHSVADYNLWEGRLPAVDRNILHAMAGVPIKAGNEVVGVLGLVFIEKGAYFSEQQMQALEQFGELASLALENARLNEESQRELLERRKVEESLRKLSVAVEQSPASIIITDTSGTIEYVNPHFTELTGYSFIEVVGQNPSFLKTGETSTEQYRKLWQTILAGGEWRGEFHNRKKNGQLYWEQALIAPIRDDNGVITHFIAIKEDITERKQLEAQLRHSQKMDAVGQLAGGIAHDFNNILTAIVGYASIIHLKLPDGSSLKKSAEQITATAERGATLTQGLLAFSRKLTSHRVTVDLNEIINRVHQLLLRLISEDINLEIKLAPQILPILADTGRIEQILMNIATNSRDAMPRGGSIVITTEAVIINSDFVLAKGFGKPGRYALLTCTDSGEGMAEDVVKHIFEPFYTTKDIGKGTGLGLSIVYGIVKEHNGYAYCNSTVGFGTVFQIYLPLLDSVPDAAEEIIIEQMAPVQGRACILLAEDDKTTRDLGREILEEFGYAVIEAVDGEDAVEKFREQQERISLVILDVIMPKMNGMETYSVIRSVAPGVRALFCSGYAKDVVSSHGVMEEGINFLAKPFTPKDLLMKIREVLNHE
ncbi:MAG TPA: PAS domain S-box protein [Desulfuromonadales bacterium]|nr:PAS domain S-box protein [Desulfuromonadales bacterium]